MECPICQSEIKDKVYMTCIAKHPFCFKCILKGVETNSSLKECSLCRGGDKYIMFEFTQTNEGSDFYTLEYFKKSMPIIQKLYNDKTNSNTCLISEQMLLAYVKNKKQIEVVNKLLENNNKLQDIFPIIKWNKNISVDEGMSIISNIASEFFGPPPTQHQGQGQGQGQPNQQPTMDMYEFIPYSFRRD